WAFGIRGVCHCSWPVDSITQANRIRALDIDTILLSAGQPYLSGLQHAGSVSSPISNFDVPRDYSISNYRPNRLLGLGNPIWVSICDNTQSLYCCGARVYRCWHFSTEPWRQGEHHLSSYFGVSGCTDTAPDRQWHQQ